MLNSLAASFRTSWAATAMALLCLLAACNGGGGNAPPPPLVFAKTGPVQETHGDNPFTNSATGGSGPITYSSSNPAVAIVGANTGTVTITGAGSATMTANAAASSQQASYSLVVVKASQSITLSSTATLDVVVGLSEAAPVSSSKGPGPLAFTSNNPTVISVNATTGAVLALDTWIGTSNTLVTAVPADAGAGFYRSTSSTCVLASYAACPNGQFDVLAASAITDTAVTTSRDGFYWIQYGANVAGPSPLAAGTFPPRAAVKYHTGRIPKPLVADRRQRCQRPAQRHLVDRRRSNLDPGDRQRCIRAARWHCRIATRQQAISRGRLE